jgi:hypothetical protein
MKPLTRRLSVKFILTVAARAAPSSHQKLLEITHLDQHLNITRGKVIADKMIAVFRISELRDSFGNDLHSSVSTLTATRKSTVSSHRLSSRPSPNFEIATYELGPGRCKPFAHRLKD